MNATEKSRNGAANARTNITGHNIITPPLLQAVYTCYPANHRKINYIAHHILEVYLYSKILTYFFASSAMVQNPYLSGIIH